MSYFEALKSHHAQQLALVRSILKGSASKSQKLDEIHALLLMSDPELEDSLAQRISVAENGQAALQEQVESLTAELEEAQDKLAEIANILDPQPTSPLPSVLDWRQLFGK